jgi:hypothetical protein
MSKKNRFFFFVALALSLCLFVIATSGINVLLAAFILALKVSLICTVAAVLGIMSLIAFFMLVLRWGNQMSEMGQIIAWQNARDRNPNIDRSEQADESPQFLWSPRRSYGNNDAACNETREPHRQRSNRPSTRVANSSFNRITNEGQKEILDDGTEVITYADGTVVKFKDGEFISWE